MPPPLSSEATSFVPVKLELTILMPCFNEEETLGTCIDAAQNFLKQHGIRGEVLIADNGSTDGSVRIAISKGARVVHVPSRGYGAALRHGISSAHGCYVIMGDCDNSYDFSRLDSFVSELRAGADLVMGNRIAGGIAPGAMPPLHRYLGNPLLSFLGRLFFSVGVGDIYCGLRGFKRNSILGLHLQSSGMEYASEMVVRSSLAHLKITEVPTTLSPDGRTRAPHLRTWADGWRGLRLLLLYSPRWLFFYPGAVILSFGLALSLFLLPGPVEILPGITIDIHSFIVGCMAMLVGAQCLSFGLIARIYAASRGLLPMNPHLERAQGWVTLERVLIVSGLLLTIGLAGLGYSVIQWAETGFGPLQYGYVLRILMISSTLSALALQIAFTAFLAALFAMDPEGR
jgi:glycosyltransferase involved in cell wall biosynthesis